MAAKRDVLLKLIEDHPTSNRAGSAMVELAGLVQADQREHVLVDAISRNPDAWYENGAQVAAFARAQLALLLANEGRMDEADALARELNARFPCAVDDQGEVLAVVEDALKLLRPPK